MLRYANGFGVGILVMALPLGGCADDDGSSNTDPSTKSDNIDNYWGILVGAKAGLPINGPAANTIYRCLAEVATTQAGTNPWYDSETGVIDMTKAPRAPGEATWTSELTITVEGSVRKVVGNGLPNHVTGEFPVASDSPVYQYANNSSAIAEQAIAWELPSVPAVANVPSCVGGTAIGIMFTGAQLNVSLNRIGVPYAAAEAHDKYDGHTEAQGGAYHYHGSTDLFDYGMPGSHSPIVGYAIDGFGIYGPRDADGYLVKNNELDECHGHVGEAPDENGDMSTVYHYHINNEFPFTLGCFKGTPISIAAH